MLTIAIPTYNRAHELQSLLEEIAAQASDVPNNQLEVVVSDNASMDDTEHLVELMGEKLDKRGIRLRYVRNRENIGFSKNVIRAVEESSCRYVLLMSDDDGLEPGTLANAFRTLMLYPDAALFFLNSTPYTFDLSKRVSSAAEVDKGETAFFQNGNDYICKVRGFPPALISGYIVNKKCWNASNASDFSYSISVHMLTAMRMLIRGCSVVRMGRACIKYRTEQTNSTWGRDSLHPFRFYLDSLMAVKIMQQEIAFKPLRCLRRVPQRTLAFYLIRQKVMQHPFSPSAFWEYYSRAKNGYGIYTVLIQLVRIAPRCIVKAVFGSLVQRENQRTGFQWKGESKNEDQ